MNRGIRVHCGVFDVEQSWRDADLSKLPGFASPENERIVTVMDELLFVFCRPEDRLLTRKKMDPAHVQYLHAIGYSFAFNAFDVEKVFRPRDRHLFRLLDEEEDPDADPRLEAFLPSGAELEPFAAVDELSSVCARFGLIASTPSMDIVRRVNTKTYSAEMRERLGLRNIATVVHGSEQLLSIGRRALADGAILLKDDFGVSGRGNLRVDSADTLERVAAYVAQQESRGRHTRFVMEPYLDRIGDFSCQLHIGDRGETRIVSVQRLANAEFAYQQSVTPDPAFIERLRGERYFDTMHRLAAELHRDGYYGHVCVDSMILRGGELVPIVEINARKSMSLIKHQVDAKVQDDRIQGSMRYYSLNLSDPNLAFEDVLAELEKREILYDPRRNAGAIPLTANTLTINRNPERPYRGRLYVYIAANGEEDGRRYDERIRDVFESLSMRLVN